MCAPSSTLSPAKLTTYRNGNVTELSWPRHSAGKGRQSGCDDIAAILSPLFPLPPLGVRHQNERTEQVLPLPGRNEATKTRPAPAPPTSSESAIPLAPQLSASTAYSVRTCSLSPAPSASSAASITDFLSLRCISPSPFRDRLDGRVRGRGRRGQVNPTDG